LRSTAVLAIGVAVAVSGALFAAPQSSSSRQQPVFRASTELVEVDVVVVDKAGNPVHGLTRDDFVVTDREKPQSIETFDEVRSDPERDASSYSCSTICTRFAAGRIRRRRSRAWS